MLDWNIQSAAISRNLEKHDAELAALRTSTKLETLQGRVEELERARMQLRASLEVLGARLASMQRR